MSDPANPIDQTRLALAALTACIVQALDEPEGGVRRAFEANLEKAYAHLREGAVDHIGAMETLGWTRDFLKEIAPR